MLSRHAGEGDSLLVLHELLVRHRRRPRVVLHEALRLEPLFDILGHRLPNRFVDPRGGDVEGEIAALAASLGDEDALLIFPEGGNFSPARRRRGIGAWSAAATRRRPPGRARCAMSARRGRAARSPRWRRRRTPTSSSSGMPARRWGSVSSGAAMAAGRTVEMRLWIVRAGDIPAGHEERIDWLFGWWRTLDAWVDERSGATATPRPP